MCILEGLQHFVLNSIPALYPFTNVNDVGPGCSNNPSTGNFECSIVGNLLQVLIDGQLGSEESPPNASSINAWSTTQGPTVTITFVYFLNLNVRQIYLYFYHIPSMGIGLPDVRLVASGQPQPYYVTGNQNLTSTDARRKNVVLSFAETITAGSRFTVNFDFSEDSNRAGAQKVYLCKKDHNYGPVWSTPLIIKKCCCRVWGVALYLKSLN